MLTAKRILVTGGAGFIGSHLCEHLLSKGSEVICLDNFYCGTRRNIHHLLHNRNFDLVRHDVTEPIRVEVDEIYNLACPASPVYYQRDPVQTIKTSVHGAINMLELAERTRAKILQTSASEIYGNTEVNPVTEDYWGRVNTNGSRACYEEGKRAAETLFYDYHRQNKTAVKVARVFNTYGPRMHPNDGQVVSSFVVAALRNKDITVFGDGSQTRSFCYVDDIVRALVSFMGETPDDFIGPMNLGNPNEYTIIDLAKGIIEMTNSRSQIVFQPLPKGEPMRRGPDIGLAQKTINWAPVTPLHQGLVKTVAYFEEYLKTNRPGP